MFSKIFHPCRGGSQISSSSTSSSSVLKKTMEMLQEKELALQKKISLEIDRAKQFSRANNRQAAMECLKRKRYYEGKMEQLELFHSRIRNQEQKLERCLTR
ncbi:vacuolar protein sorting-associated protein 32 homolog 2-like [Zingiber officinale]|uniref:vacuolar protein sorting-associated protein 32 homolog 2-like n=1 Tax=Zingiber officinale TaxID=94328 RepID=UPI001C4B5768|nr:vacuolar protein sorting-associated protein 32 homolog 2-like isoform X2 [Zingiber officinale]XP_042394166.1 vacuolar protein sorting-associated protein 32 homolog 2-like [Zingiber officinale]